MDFEVDSAEATDPIHGSCPYCEAEGMLRISQTVSRGTLRWHESLNCQNCRKVTESGGVGFPPDAIRERLRSVHGEWAVLLEVINSAHNAAKTLRQHLGLDSRDALVSMRAGQSDGVFSGTRVECEWLASKLALSSERPVLQRRAASEHTLQGDPVG